MYDRRQFLSSSLAAAATAALAGPVAAIEPIARNGQPKFKFSLAAYSYRSLLSRARQPELTLKDFIDDCAKFGLEGTELTSYYFPKDTTPDYVCGRCGGSAFGWGWMSRARRSATSSAIPPGEKRDAEIAKTQAVDRLCRDPRRAGDPHLCRAPAEGPDRGRGPFADGFGDRGMLRLRRQARRASGPGEPRRADGHGRRACSSSSAT